MTPCAAPSKNRVGKSRTTRTSSVWAGGKDYIDLGAKIIAARKGEEKIAVEIKSFSGVSDLDQFEDALGQFLIYLMALERKEADRTLYLAVPETFYESFFDDPFFLDVAKRYEVRMVVFNFKSDTIVKWTN